MKVADAIRYLQSMPQDADLLTCHTFGLYHVVDGMHHAMPENKVVLAGHLWMKGES